MHFRRLWNGMFGGVEGQYTTIVRNVDNLRIKGALLIAKLHPQINSRFELKL